MRFHIDPSEIYIPDYRAIKRRLYGEPSRAPSRVDERAREADLKAAMYEASLLDKERQRLARIETSKVRIRWREQQAEKLRRLKMGKWMGVYEAMSDDMRLICDLVAEKHKIPAQFLVIVGRADHRVCYARAEFLSEVRSKLGMATHAIGAVLGMSRDVVQRCIALHERATMAEDPAISKEHYERLMRMESRAKRSAERKRLARLEAKKEKALA